ncbi:peptidoglycan DD-metalloendopeptidase family protein [Micrococcus luteus]|uniref:murein hydrolase activator EnvC family protein n=1 Tax=Micrococcus TaxID=1269 RepID=UPI0009BFFD55|nr:peptidoglycan DD-metalloendopeptidase family protein [Micrococcus luteus]MCC0765942.1 peptidoglycan DD-metalloendopeptidase family protein [Micrococcus luteus]MCV7512044.1 peptidoglycan DD-metalloendopeptidase family protein [Micrococcus luteus]MCV7520699.1 peptidoglycan DD-metalloendopeptidase family protein [Micrococcus luteus]MCV7572250.1 peptidoglycan DD-metalloendopeptidase family protein [Micrococcus luteus]MCV7740894.1 peptidoglycan DD-metalloendopeptidase family protein [Micrococcus
MTPRTRLPRQLPRPHIAGCVAAALLAWLLLALGVGGLDPVPRASSAPSGRDARLLVAASPAGPGSTAAPVAWHAPVAGAAPGDVLRAFVAPERPWGRGHRGVDLAVPSGAAIRAPAAGRVVFAGVVVDRPVLTLEHADGTRSSLEPVEADVTVGAVVAAGDPVGRLAEASPHCPRACVHWGVREPDGWRVGDAAFDRYLDPLVLIGWSGPSVLWPHAAPYPARP